MPQHELQGFLRTAELLEIKGLLKDVDEVSWPQQGVQPGPQHQQQQPTSLSSLVQTNHSKQTIPLNLNHSSSNNNNNVMLGNSGLANLPNVPVSTIVLTNTMADSK